jgi:class 3 adenylate cyclase
MKMPVKDPSKKTSSHKAPDANRCVFETSDGRRCRHPHWRLPDRHGHQLRRRQGVHRWSPRTVFLPALPTPSPI